MTCRSIKSLPFLGLSRVNSYGIAQTVAASLISKEKGITMKRLDVIKNELVDFKSSYDVRDTWHEPDEQGVSAIVTGQYLDNAFGSDQPAGLVNSEYVVHLMIDGRTEMRVNVADLLALATK